MTPLQKMRLHVLDQKRKAYAEWLIANVETVSLLSAREANEIIYKAMTGEYDADLPKFWAEHKTPIRGLN